MRRRRAWLLAILLGVAPLCCGGCGERGPVRYKLSGTVTYAGQPIKVGMIVFEPAAGNTGPGESAKIVDGRYETPKGLVPGVMKATIQGCDGIPYEVPGEGINANGKELFAPYATTVDMPAADLEKSFDVPAAGR
jgi:hypothetical protein